MKSKTKSKKKDQHCNKVVHRKREDILKLMKNNISNGNKSYSTNDINFNNLNEAKSVIVSISNELEFQQKETLKCAIRAGEYLHKI